MREGSVKPAVAGAHFRDRVKRRAGYIKGVLDKDQCSEGLGLRDAACGHPISGAGMDGALSLGWAGVTGKIQTYS